MKTTIDIADSILEQARELAARRGTTLRALVEDGLRRVVDDRREETAFRLRRVTYGGRGLRSEMADAGWDALRDVAYRGRGA
jgi:hypothetical protein